ncbi:MAG: Ig-like domain-containing protein [Terriglobales bacterium]
MAWKPATFGIIVQYNVYRVNGLSSTLIACVYVGTSLVPSGCVQGDPYATSYNYPDNGAPANSTYSVTTVDLDPVSNLPRESTPQGSGAAQALLNLSVTTPLTYGSSETLSASGGSTSGAVTFYLLSGPCIVSGTQLTANSGTGSCSVAATMAGDSTYNPVTSAVLIISLQKANAAITVTPYSVTYDGNAHTATGTATGVKGESLNGLNLSATTHTAAGVYNDTWTFTDGTGNYNNASGTVLDTITQSSTATALSATPNPANFGQSVSLQATVTPIPPGTGTPTGTVTFKDGGTPLSTVTMSSAAASFVTSSLAPGTHNLTASYSGDANFSQSSSAVLAEQIVCGLLLSISPSTVKQGGTVTVAAKLISCSTSAQTVVVKFTLSGPLQPNSCSSTKTDIFTTPPFTLPPKTSKSISFPFPILKRTCTGTYTITATTLVNGTAVNTSTASLKITSH